MSGLAVRRALVDDASRVADVALCPYAAGWTRAAYAAEAVRDDSIFFVADDGEVRGYVVARAADEEVQVLDLAVERAGRGIGRALWEALCAAARERGAKRLTLEVSERNARAIAFYEKAGARVVGRRAKFYNDGADAILMDLSLP